MYTLTIFKRLIKWLIKAIKISMLVMFMLVLMGFFWLNHGNISAMFTDEFRFEKYADKASMNAALLERHPIRSSCQDIHDTLLASGARYKGSYKRSELKKKPGLEYQVFGRLDTDSVITHSYGRFTMVSWRYAKRWSVGFRCDIMNKITKLVVSNPTLL